MHIEEISLFSISLSPFCLHSPHILSILPCVVLFEGSSSSLSFQWDILHATIGYSSNHHHHRRRRHNNIMRQILGGVNSRGEWEEHNNNSSSRNEWRREDRQLLMLSLHSVLREFAREGERKAEIWLLCSLCRRMLLRYNIVNSPPFYSCWLFIRVFVVLSRRIEFGTEGSYCNACMAFTNQHYIALQRLCLADMQMLNLLFLSNIIIRVSVQDIKAINQYWSFLESEVQAKSAQCVDFDILWMGKHFFANSTLHVMSVAQPKEITTTKVNGKSLPTFQPKKLRQRERTGFNDSIIQRQVSWWSTEKQ